jgi:Protein of unknown function (DUF3102)
MSKITKQAKERKRAELLKQHANEIRRLGKRAVADIIEIGQRLIEAKKFAGHGNWLPWLKREFGWSDRAANNFMLVAEGAKSANFADFNVPVSSLYRLAAPSTPAGVIEAVADGSARGESFTNKQIKTMINGMEFTSVDCTAQPYLVRYTSVDSTAAPVRYTSRADTRKASAIRADRAVSLLEELGDLSRRCSPEAVADALRGHRRLRTLLAGMTFATEIRSALSVPSPCGGPPTVPKNSDHLHVVK